MEYAPVIIPTLNRYEHFKKCLESLEQCTGANKTEIYVGLDFPPSNKYVDGWKKIDEYLKEKEYNNGFARLIVLRRNHNCGVCNPNSNGALLQRYMIAHFDRFILSEDDNVFSPNFLEYINDGLKRFENDENCMAICGYNYYGMNMVNYPYNIYASREFSAWGVGYWTKKVDKLKDITTMEFCKSIVGSWSNIFKIYRHEPRLLNTVMLNIASGKIFGDTMKVSYQYLSNCYSIFPTISKVRNMGFDNSGTSIFKDDDNYNKQKIDKSSTFEMDNIEPIVLPETQREVDRFFKRSFAMNVLILIRLFVYKLTGIDICLREIKKRNKALFNNT